MPIVLIVSLTEQGLSAQSINAEVQHGADQATSELRIIQQRVELPLNEFEVGQGLWRNNVTHLILVEPG